MIELKNIHKNYEMGETSVRALRGVSLKIDGGEFVAIMGPSGSGKSTLMHIIGLLDTPTSGTYRLCDRETSRLDEDSLAVLRRGTVGFIFQQFNLLPRMTAIENVSLPLIYSKKTENINKAEKYLERLGLGKRFDHRPNELSGGQQQRVAIARALINSPGMILADEPTGNLDSASAQEIITVLKELNAQGITIVIVTHEEDIGHQAKRLIRMHDGVIRSDETLKTFTPSPPSPLKGEGARKDSFNLLELWDHFRQGFRTLAANKVRTGLSMLGILVGVAAVVAMLAIGKGAQTAIETQLSSLGSNLLMLRPGAVTMGGVVLETGAATRLTLEDAAAIKETIPAVKESSPTVMGRGQVTFQDKNWSTQVQGVGPAFADMRNSAPDIGRFFTDQENHERALVAVIGATVVREVFGDQSPIGEMIKINKVNFRVIGILPEKGATGWRDQDDVIVMPVLTAMHRLFGKDYVDYIDIEAVGAEETDMAQEDVMKLMLARHKVPPSQQQDAFQVRNMADIKAALSENSKTMSILLSSIAAISLLVGGIGIMNIMIVSVTERTREIGLRKAIGARKIDIMSQFLTEAVEIGLFGGSAGIFLGWCCIKLVSFFFGWSTSVSIESIVLSFSFSAGIGIIFGLYPAKKAARLNPIDALRYE